MDLIRIATRISGSIPKKYDHIDFHPPKSVQDEAAKGLEFRKKAGGKGGLTPGQASKEGIGSGVTRATSLRDGNQQSPDTVRRMKAFFSRFEKAKEIDKEHRSEPWKDRGYVAWLLWGGDAGKSWSNKVCRQMDAADKNE